MIKQSTFEQDGFGIIPQLYSEDELTNIRNVLRHNPEPNTAIWDKALCASSRNFLNFAKHPKIVECLQNLLGPDFILWGGTYIERKPGQVHIWHTDIESSSPDGGFVTVWIGIEGTNQNSSLKLVPGSHRFGQPLQQVMQAQGIERADTSDANVTNWAKAFDAQHSGLEQPDVRNGDAIVFDGRLWHGSANTNTDATRTAFLFQYARADAPVHIPNYKKLTWPFNFLEYPKPPCIALSGQCSETTNLIAEAPPVLDNNLQTLAPKTCPIDFETKIPEGKKIQPTPLLFGHSPNTQQLGAHYSVLAPGQSPHLPHSHVHEELLIVLKGQAQLRFDNDRGEIIDTNVGVGDGIYYPGFHRHTIYNNSEFPVFYLMLKWVAAKTQTKQTLPLQQFRISPLDQPTAEQKKFTTRELFTGQTNQLRLLHAHESTLLPGGGYAPHADTHDVVLITLEGVIETNGQSIQPGTLVWHPANQNHDLWNRSTQPARYLVIEFHGENCTGDYATYTQPKKSKKADKSLIKQRSLKRILRNIKRLFGLK